MFDGANRRKAAGLLQAFLRQERTGDEVYEQWPRGSDDAGLPEIYFNLVMDGIEDIGVFRAEEHAEIVPVIRNCIRFLESDLPYEWPLYFTWTRLLSPMPFVEPLLVLLPAAGIGSLIAMILPGSTVVRGYIGAGIGAVCGAAMSALVMSRSREWRMKRRQTDDDRYWPYRNAHSVPGNDA
jgi:hypothetical protein